MRTLFVLTAIVLLSPLAMAKVWTTVYRYDEKTPLGVIDGNHPVDANHPTIYRDIMVGTHLVIVISSDTVVPWSGMLRLSREDANELTLSGRGYDPGSGNYVGSCLEAAGMDVIVQSFEDTNNLGFWYNNDPFTAVPGDWFAFDYYAAQIGSVVIEVGDLDPNSLTPGEVLSFTHVPSRDFNGDHVVNFEDLALLAKTWRLPAAPDANNPGAKFDLDADSRVDVADLALFAGYWLERTDCNEPAATPMDSPTAP
jgi:hypothetical protein